MAGQRRRRSWTLAAAASLIVMAARRAPEGWEDAPGIAAQAAAIRWRSEALAEDNARAFLAALKLLDAPGAGDEKLRQALDEATAGPRSMVELAAHLAELARIAGPRTEPSLRADCDVAALLAAAAAQAGARLLEVNLTVAPDDERVTYARDLAHAASFSARRALDAES